MSIFSGLFRSRDKPTNSTTGSSYRFFFGGTTSEALRRIDEQTLLQVFEGVPQFRIGRHTDILEGCTKKQAALMLLKTMSPELLAMDEITSPEDIDAVALCAHCGTAVLATAHARDVSDLRCRPLYRRLLSLGVFERVMVISCKDGKRFYRMEKTEGLQC